MMRHRRFVAFGGVLAVGVVVTIVAWRPWQARVRPAASEDPVPPADMVSVTILNRLGGPCRVEILGTGGGASNLASASLAAGETRSVPLRFPAPYTVETVTVTRDGNPRRRQVNVTLAGGRRYELQVNADDTVAVAQVPR